MTRIAPGIHRLGHGVVNAYLLDDAGSVTIIDTGIPGYWRDLPDELAAMGHTLDDVRAVVLTHGHNDHVGFAERIRSERGLLVQLHAADAALARGEVKSANAARLQWRLGPTVSFLWYAARGGMLRTRPLREVSTFDDGAVLDVPGSPRVVHVPGHTAGSAALHVPSHSALFIGDAIVTLDVMTGRTGPMISGFTADPAAAQASLDRLDGIEAAVVLPGHGQPWTGGVAEAVRLARAGSPRA